MSMKRRHFLRRVAAGAIGAVGSLLAVGRSPDLVGRQDTDDVTSANPGWVPYDGSRGYNGGLPYDGDPPPIKLDTTVPPFKNYTATYSEVTKKDLIEKMRAAHQKIKFQAPSTRELMEHINEKYDLGLNVNWYFPRPTETAYHHHPLPKVDIGRIFLDMNYNYIDIAQSHKRRFAGLT
jgi:hypothetical protein